MATHKWQFAPRFKRNAFGWKSDAPMLRIKEAVAEIKPSEVGKWFAAAKSAGLFSEAIELVAKSPTDPRTLTRAARDHAQTQPLFALDAALAALHWMARGFGYDITGAEVQEAFQAGLAASRNVGRSDRQTMQQVRALLARPGAAQKSLAKILARELAE